MHDYVCSAVRSETKCTPPSIHFHNVSGFDIKSFDGQVFYIVLNNITNLLYIFRWSASSCEQILCNKGIFLARLFSICFSTRISVALQSSLYLYSVKRVGIV